MHSIVIEPPEEYMPRRVRIERNGSTLAKFAARINMLQKCAFGATLIKFEFTHETGNIVRLRTNLQASYVPVLRNCEILARVANDANVYVLQADRVMNRRTTLDVYIKRTDGSLAECVLYYTDDNVLDIVDIGYNC